MFFIVIVSVLTITAASDWNKMAKDSLTSSINMKRNYNLAKNIILFIGDGMGMSTITASRIYKGQKENRTGEETILKFEEFPNVALSKIYGVDRQVPGSAMTATALMCGVKTNFKVIGYNENVKAADCEAAIEGNKAQSILNHFRKAGRSTGVVSTARITHATPAAAYAHSAHRDWENDAKFKSFNVTGDCKDIAYQLVYNNNDIQVALGGGRTHFLPDTMNDPEYGEPGSRTDGLDLTTVWRGIQSTNGRSHVYAWNKEQFDAIDPTTTDNVLGLFETYHMQYEVDRNKSMEPSLMEMTEKAIDILKKNQKGFFLMVEGGRIDHAHHDTKAARALEETLAFEEAVIRATEMTNSEETLIIVTADHSHTFTIGGYPHRGNDILGIVKPEDYEPALDGMPYTTLAYANGPGVNFTTGRPNVTTVDTGSFDYIQQAGVPVDQETHSGEDVPIFAIGPVSHLFHGVQEQNYVAHVMQYAACVGDYANDCNRNVPLPPTGSSNSLLYSLFVVCLCVFTCLFI